MDVHLDFSNANMKDTSEKYCLTGYHPDLPQFVNLKGTQAKITLANCPIIMMLS